MRSKVLIADSNYITRKGLAALVSESDSFIVIAEAIDHDDLVEKCLLYNPQMIVIDYASPSFSVDSVLHIIKKYPKINILAVTPMLSASVMTKVFEMGVKSYVLKDCDQFEITTAFQKTNDGDKFVCGKILDKLLQNSPKEKSTSLNTQSVSCEGINLTAREMEIVQFIAHGFSNKEIADKLFLSTHTVTTHRKNVMSKLGVNNTAGVVMYAVKNDLLSPNKFLFS